MCGFTYTLSDIIGVTLFGLLLIGIAIWAITDWLRQTLCKHESYYENRACNAICNRCGKNLGFIGNLRDKHGSKS